MSRPLPITPDRMHPCRQAPSPSSRASRSGFALLVTIVLVAFLVLLLVSLATFTRVETQVAANSQQMAQARQNALFSLNLAIGQLQKYAGSDQAVTARADIDPANTGNPFWTGVWDAGPPDPLNASHAAPPVSSAPMVWLVSGNEINGVALKPDAAPVADPAPGNDNVWLLRTLLGQDLAPDITGGHPQDGRIKLAKSLITLPANQVPGFGGGNTTPIGIGAFAWWVGDEGIKAKINLDDPWRGEAADSGEAAWRRHAAPRPGIDLLANAPVLASVFTNTTDAFETLRSRLITYTQIPMLHAALATSGAMAQTAHASHDLTTDGHGVLSDTLHGGLRRDLTRGLAAAPSAGSMGSAEIGDDMAVFTLPTPGLYGRTASGTWSGSTLNGEPHAPTWGQVRAWTAIRADSSNNMNPVAAPLATTTRNGITAPAAAGHAIMPVPVMLEIGWGLDVSSGGKYHVMLRPRVVLMNPYNVTLRNANYCLVYQSTTVGKSDLSFSLSYNQTSEEGGGTLSDSQDFFLRDIFNLDGTDGKVAFNITDSFDPGEIKIYSLPASATADIALGAAATIIDLEPGLSTVRAYVETDAQAPGWYVHTDEKRALCKVQLGHMPQDHPRIDFALGKAAPGTTPVSSLVSRNLPLSSVLYAKPYPQAGLNTDEARQLRTLRIALRHADMDRLNYDSTTANNPGLGKDLPDDDSSGDRFLVDANIRATVSQRLNGRDNVAHYLATSFKYQDYTEIDHEVSGGDTLGYWGGSVESSDGSTHAILFDVLRENEEIVSLGRLGQVNWGVDAKHPAYPLGNSFASVFYPHDQPDYGYALNEALWDRFFISTLPASLATHPTRLPNSRLRFHDPAGVPADLTALEGADGYQLAATRLLIDGAFNVNSTSVEAWAAFLGSVQAADYAYRTRSGTRTDSNVRPFPRLSRLHDRDPSVSKNNMYEWTGYRSLETARLQALASEIVKGIKARGRPARSLAEFINRDLSRSATDPRNQMGVVQAAIDAVVNTADPSTSGGGRDGLKDLPGLDPAKIVPASFDNADNPDAARGKLRATGAPGFLLQSDLLAPLAPAMSARSDTFRVRACGEVRNPVTGEISGRAWCEAIVQRLPEFVGRESAELRLDDPALGAASRTFGRKFVITRFRWLSPDEI
ncbi:hypothetical protein OPIT5_15005 [Opitutaceae bacterium TAV5]|nr:hypothetical protein OPIT5_15005 [Opitutaceae bacterium TAV5]